MAKARAKTKKAAKPAKKTKRPARTAKPSTRRKRGEARAAARPTVAPLLGEAKRAWLTALVQRAERNGLPALDEVLGEIASKVTAETFAELPDLHARLAALDVAPVLARSLRAGLLDEFGWPALEDAAAELGGDTLTLHGGLPAVIVANATRAIAVSPRERLGVHELVIPRKHELLSLRFIGGQFLVLLARGEKARAYWSGAPRDVFDVDAKPARAAALAWRACVLPDGAWLEGTRRVRAGDRAWPDAALTACDGETAWVLDAKDGRHREIAATGELGPCSWAEVLEAGLQPEWLLDGHASYVLPAPEGLDTSPLGANDGMLGLRVSYPASGPAREVMRIDGRTWSGPTDVRPYELLALPGGELRPLMIETGSRDGMTVAIVDDKGRLAGSKIGAGDKRYWRGSVAAYPAGLWHALVARDPEGSAWLRAAGDADARALLIDALASKTLDELAEAVPVEIVERSIRDIEHPRLRAGVAGMIALAAQLQLWRDKLCDERAPGKTTARSW